MNILHKRPAIQLVTGTFQSAKFGRAARAASAMLLAFAVVTLLGACASLPQDYESPQSFVLADTSQTSLARQLAPQVAAHPQKSGFFPLITGNDALVARAGVMQAAELTLDVQYYIWHPDTSGRLLVELLLQAADRGVRVRILLDDLDTSGKDFGLVSMNAHPNIEIRLYNPFADRGFRAMSFLTDLRRVNRRMHNKSLTADNQVTIVGGRNIGNEYFGGKSDTQFSDLDVLAVGPVVNEVSKAFDAYWNSAWVIPVSAFDDGATISDDDLDQARADLVQYIEEQKSSPYAEALRASRLLQKATFADLDYSWGEASLLYDAPNKAEGTQVTAATHIGPHLLQVFDRAQQELIVISPYFVPGKALVDYFGELVGRGVRVRILTNSLASSDVSLVHAGYMRYRTGLLKSGVELYEFKPVVGAEELKKQRSWTGSSKASLHAKLFGVDRKALFVGSFNLDPRSVLHNTEMGVLFESPGLAGQLGDGFDNELLQKAYRVQFRYEPDDGDEKLARLEWVTKEDGSEIHYYKEPETSFLQRLSVGFLSIFVPESML
jgi:putative cardiolipin synthase